MRPDKYFPFEHPSTHEPLSGAFGLGGMASGDSGRSFRGGNNQRGTNPGRIIAWALDFLPVWITAILADVLTPQCKSSAFTTVPLENNHEVME
jgi:hypothetical protein